MPFYDKIQVEFNREATHILTPSGDDVAAIELSVNGECTAAFARRVVLIAKMERLLRKLCRAANASDFAEDVRAKREARETFADLDDTDDADERGARRMLDADERRAEREATIACDRYHRLKDNPELAETPY